MSRGTFVIISMTCAMVLVILVCAFRVGLIDDSYIFLRYARNLAEGNGLVFNAGERVEGFSSPLWTLMLGTAGILVSDLEALAQVLGICCGTGVIVLLLYGPCSTGRLGSWDAVVFGLGLATSPSLVFWSASGMDASLFLLLITTSLISILKDRVSPVCAARPGMSVKTAVLLFLATLARPEGVLLAAYAAAFFLYERRSIRMLYGYAGAVAAMLLARYAYYGTWVPNTYYAKVTFGLSRRLSDGASYLLEALRAYAPLIAGMIILLFVLARGGGTTLGGGMYRLLEEPRELKPAARKWFVITCAHLKRKLSGQSKGPVAFIGGWVILWIGYVLYVGGDNFALFRFLLPALPALFLLSVWCWSAMMGEFSRPVHSACLGGLLAALAVSHVETYRSQAHMYLADAALARSWGKVGRWLERETAPETVIATIVPGAVGYFSRRPTVDMLGLTDRTVGRHGKVFPQAAHGHARYHTDYLFHRRPDIILYHSSGRFTSPRYADSRSIPRRHGFALYDFVNDRRCTERYAYECVELDDGTWIEMQKRRLPMNPPEALTRR